MPDEARVLAFRPRRSGVTVAGPDAVATASAYLGSTPEERETLPVDTIFANPDVLMHLCSALRNRVNTDPVVVANEASRLFNWIASRSEGLGYFDEREYFLGEAALLAGGASRLLGNRSETELWLDRADANFRHTINPAAHLARVAYIRLALRYDMRRHEDVLELMPSVELTFRRAGMLEDLGKCRFLQAMSLKELGRAEDAASAFRCIVEDSGFRNDQALRGLSLLNLGNLQSSQGKYEVALANYAEARPLLEAARRYSTLADLKAMVGETLREVGQIQSAVEAYREAVNDHAELGMTTRVAYLRVVLGEALLESGRPREAEWELLQALPTIEEQAMVPEGFAAVALLRESIRSRVTDPNALAELRRHLQATV